MALLFGYDEVCYRISPGLLINTITNLYQPENVLAIGMTKRGDNTIEFDGRCAFNKGEFTEYIRIGIIKVYQSYGEIEEPGARKKKFKELIGTDEKIKKMIELIAPETDTFVKDWYIL